MRRSRRSEWQEGKFIGDLWKKQIGERIREARIKRFKGTVTMADLAKILGVPYRTYQDWELGKNTPKHETIIKLGNILKTDPAYLRFGHELRVQEVESEK
ncbi:MAG: hypothetical protein A2026_13980 [Deltaproteobacteria bacterium RBG_19FT_COMBO_46_12]|nr:MAG: hypothetical protein A2026_13980 [Deltaproteobacteria bacterium RBG_19FT_COMBO_46_12]